MKCSQISRKKGFTLIELTVGMLLGMSIGAIVLAMFNQQLTFLSIYRTQSFLNEEAPIVSLHVSRLIGKADRFRLHDSLTDALSGLNPRLGPSPVVVLNYRQPDGAMRAAILAFEDLGTGPALYYYVVPVRGVLGAPEWIVTKKPANVQFTMEAGILRMILTGPANEQIIYSGSMQQ